MQPTQNEILKKIASNSCTKLLDKEVVQGIRILKSKAPINPDFTLSRKLIARFESSSTEFQRFTEAERALLMPYVDTADITRYYTEPNGEHYALFIDENLMQELYTGLYPNLLRSIREHRDNGTLHPFIGSADVYRHKRIIVPKRKSSPTFSFADKQYMVSSPSNIITTERFDLGLLTSYLNSKVSKFWIINATPVTTIFKAVDRKALTSLPIIKLNDSAKLAIQAVSEYLMYILLYYRNKSNRHDYRSLYHESFLHLSEMLFIEALYRDEFIRHNVRIAELVNELLPPLSTYRPLSRDEAVDNAYRIIDMTSSKIRNSIRYIEVVMSDKINPILNTL